MKILTSLLTAGLANNCPDLSTTNGYQSIANGAIKGDCGTGEGTVCKVKCDSGFSLNHFAWSVFSTCLCQDSTCDWSYGSTYGSGVGNTNPQFGCCKKRTQTCGKSQSGVHLARNFGKSYAEADAKYALMNFKMKLTTAATNGFSFLLTFPSLIPDDVSFETFARLEVADVYRDERSGKSFVMMNSKAGFETVAENEKMAVSFGMKSSGDTNMKDFMDANNFSMKYFNERNDCFCAGNSALCEQLNPSPTKFASFNIQVFGQAKYGKTEVKDQIVTILRRYDVSTIQEIRDSAETAFPNLVGDMNSFEDIYDYHFGARQGSTSSKESEGFIWNRNKFNLVDAYDFDDTNGWFERPPTIVVLERIGASAPNYKTNSFIIISTHIKPESGVEDMTTENEINHLADVYADAVSKHPTVTSAIIAGDMNAGCTYVAAPEAMTLYTDPLSEWLIPFDADTTVKDTNCAYDHLVLYGDIQNHHQDAAVFNYETFYDTENIFYEGTPITDLISDHYPIEFSFY